MMTKKTKFILSFFLMLLLFVATAWVLSESNRLTNSTICSEIAVEIKEAAFVFVEEKDVIRQLRESPYYPQGKELEAISTYQMEQEVLKNAYVKSVEAFVNLNGEAKVRIQQRIPFIRVVNAYGESFYIDEEGYCLPLSDEYSSRLLFVNGYIREHFKRGANVLTDRDENGVLLYPSMKAVFELAEYIDQDPFFRAQLEQVFVNREGEFELTPMVGRQHILLGNLDRLEDKFNRLYYFYTAGVKKSGWNKYDKINLKYKGQVICTKR